MASNNPIFANNYSLYSNDPGGLMASQKKQCFTGKGYVSHASGLVSGLGITGTLAGLFILADSLISTSFEFLTVDQILWMEYGIMTTTSMFQPKPFEPARPVWIETGLSAYIVTLSNPDPTSYDMRMWVNGFPLSRGGLGANV